MGTWLAGIGPKGIRELCLNFSGQKKLPAGRHLDQHPGKYPSLFNRLDKRLRRYLDGKPEAFDLPLDFGEMTPFQLNVTTTLRTVAFGKTISYGDLARSAGFPGAARAVGQCMSRNRLIVMVPCHRVLAARGGLGGYSGGIDIKLKLLHLEKALVPLP